LPPSAAWRPAGDDAPEDWAASTTPVYGDDELGLTRLADGTRLLDLFAGNPEAFFEPAHWERFGEDSALLLKLLDAGKRLPIHFHPDDAFATSELGAPYGKTEAWVILEAVPGAGQAPEPELDRLAVRPPEALPTHAFHRPPDSRHRRSRQAPQRDPPGPGARTRRRHWLLRRRRRRPPRTQPRLGDRA
jgi:hypothetical protein